MEQLSLTWQPPQRRTYSVGELNQEIRALLDEHFGTVLVTGEISGTKRAASGHWYFTLKDDGAQLRCVCFRNAARFLKVQPQDGLAVLARGRIEVYEARGEYQLMVESLEPQGLGALQMAFEQLKVRLKAEGLFDAERKRPLPMLPRRIGIVTSPTGAVIQDMLNVLHRRHPGLHIRLYPCLVQGEGSVEQVCRGLRHFSQSGWADVVIVARGGGSLEDLWSFNDEAVARAIADCATPVVSAVGHETDFTIADFVADLRAPTPSAAAELVVPTRDELLDQVDALRRHLCQSMRLSLADARRALQIQGTERARMVLHRAVNRHQRRLDELDELLRDRLREALLRGDRSCREWESRLQRTDVRLRLASARQRLQLADSALRQRMHLLLIDARCRLDPQAVQLAQLSPLRVLERGYAIVERENVVLKDAAEAPDGTDLSIRLHKGRLAARVLTQE